MRAIKVLYKINVKGSQFFGSTEYYINININDYEAPSAEDSIKITLPGGMTEVRKHATEYGFFEEIDCFMVTCYEAKYTSGAPILHAINFLFDKNYWPSQDTIPDLQKLKDQLLHYQSNLLLPNLISRENRWLIVLPIIKKTLNKIVAFPFTLKKERKLGALCSEAPNKLVPKEIYRVFGLLVQLSKENKSISMEAYKNLADTVARELMPQTPAQPSRSFFPSFRHNPMPCSDRYMEALYSDIVSAFSLSSLLPLTSKRMTGIIGDITVLPPPLAELVTDYIGFSL